MKDISHRQSTLQTAQAMAIVFCKAETVAHVAEQQLQGGMLFDMARAAGFLAAKLSPQFLPQTLVPNLEGVDLSFGFLHELKDEEQLPGLEGSSGIFIQSTVRSIGRINIEMEALSAASIAALHIYESLKAKDQALEIGKISLIKQKEKHKKNEDTLTCAILVCGSDIASGQRADKTGQWIKERLTAENTNIVAYELVSDNKTEIQNQVLQWVAQDIDFIFTTGGTGLGPKDLTVSAITEILERHADGITSAMRHFGEARTPMTMMGLLAAGIIKDSLVLTLPGSSNGARESLDALLPTLFHTRKILKGGRKR